MPTYYLTNKLSPTHLFNQSNFMVCIADDKIKATSIFKRLVIESGQYEQTKLIKSDDIEELRPGTGQLIYYRRPLS